MDIEEPLEELRANLIEYDEHVVLDALILNNVIDQDTGMLTDYWLNLLNPKLLTKSTNVMLANEEQIVLSALAKILQRHIK